MKTHTTKTASPTKAPAVRKARKTVKPTAAPDVAVAGKHTSKADKPFYTGCNSPDGCASPGSPKPGQKVVDE